MALPRGAMGLSAVCDCGISCSYSLTIFGASLNLLGNLSIKLAVAIVSVGYTYQKKKLVSI